MRHAALRPVLAFVSVVAVAAAGCYEAAREVASVSGPSVRSDAAPTAPAGPPMAVPAQGVLIKHGTVSLVVTDADTAEQKIRDLMKIHGAYVASRESRATVHPGRTLGPSEVHSLTLTIKVEAKAFDAFLAGVKQAGSFTSEDVRVEDVTFAYMDLNARLANQRRVEERLLKYLDDPSRDYKMVLEVEKELARVREQVEQLSAQLRVMENQIAYSTVVLHLNVRADWVPPEERSFAADVGEALSASISALGEAARLAVLFAVAAVPWMIVIAVVVFAVFLVARRRKRG
jgi:hypothetical protein